MPRTCIICGGATGSREHIFPAALGGRRTNKGIYCGDHNNAYSDLAAVISNQLDFFNAQLGVVGDHADTPTSVTMTDVASGHEIKLSNGQVQFKYPQTRAEKTEGGQTVTEMAFNTMKEAKDWAAEQKKLGVDVQFLGKGQKTRYHLGTAHKQITFGGNEDGLRSIAYIAQTFFAHSFPEVARLPELQKIKDYTLNNVGTGFVWWDFEPPTNLPPNSFPFGHRVIVGFNSEDGTVYARLSFFSALNFAILLENVPVKASHAVITDIDPLAKSPPNDINTWSMDTATGTVSRPNSLSASLNNAIHTGQAKAQIEELMRRITDFERETAAAKIMEQIDGTTIQSSADRNALFTKIISGETQRVWNLMNYVANNLKQRAVNPVEYAMADFMEQAIKLDPTMENGLNTEATRSLTIACNALAKQMSEDFETGMLDQDRVSMLIGGGAGAYVVGIALSEEFMRNIPTQ